MAFTTDATKVSVSTVPPLPPPPVPSTFIPWRIPVVLVRVTVVLVSSNVVVNPVTTLGLWIPSLNSENLNGWEALPLLNLYVLPAYNVKAGWYVSPDPVSRKNLLIPARVESETVVLGTPTLAAVLWSVKLPPEAATNKVIFPPEVTTS